MEGIKEILPRTLGKHGLIKGIQERRIVHDWKDLVGETIAAHTHPQEISRGKLIVRVDSSAWLHQLKFLKSDILQILQQKVGEEIVKDICFTVGQF